MSVSIKVDTSAILNNKHLGKAEPTKDIARKIALKQILDKWTACTISVEDAEKELIDLLASQRIGQVDINAGNLKVESKYGMGYQGTWEMDGYPLPSFTKLTLVFEIQKMPRMILETKVSPSQKREP